jgi:hypothetical protein
MQYLDFLKLFITKDHLKVSFENKNKKTFNIKAIKTTISKVLLLEKFEDHYNIKRLILDDFKVENIENKLDDDSQNLIKNLFRKKKLTLNNEYKILQEYISMIKNICGDIPIITNKKTTKNKKSIYKYSLNIEMITKLITLCKFKNPGLKNYNHELIKLLTGIIPDEVENKKFMVDEEEDYENYKFGKMKGDKKYNCEIDKNEELNIIQRNMWKNMINDMIMNKTKEKILMNNESNTDEYYKRVFFSNMGNYELLMNNKTKK